MMETPYENRMVAPETDFPPVAEEMTFGPRLRIERMRRNFSLRDMEDRTRIRISYLRALEEEDLAALPEPIFIKGFLRSYSLALGLDPEDFLSACRTRFTDMDDRKVLNVDPFKPKTFQEKLSRSFGSLKRLLTGREDHQLF